jgi:hypothetical protein
MPAIGPDPSIPKDGDDYYMTFSSFNAYPASSSGTRDLVNFGQIRTGVVQERRLSLGADLVKPWGRYYIYFPGIAPYRSQLRDWADNIRDRERSDRSQITRIDPVTLLGQMAADTCSSALAGGAARR